MSRFGRLVGIWTVALVAGWAVVVLLGGPVATAADDLDAAMHPVTPVTEAGAYASWISPPKVGIDNRPGDFEYVSVTGPTASVAVTVNVPTFQPVDWFASIVSAGAVITGAVVSCTLIVKVLEEWFPYASVAVTVTVVVPSAKVAPEVFE